MKTLSISLSELFGIKDLKSLIRNHKKICMMLFVAVISAMTLTADEFGVAQSMEVIIEFLMSPWVRGLIFIALFVECILLVTAGRADGQAFKKFIPIIAGTILLLAAPTIIKKFTEGLETSKSNATSLLGN